MHELPLDGSIRPESSATEIYETKISQIGLEIAVSSYSIFNRCNMDQRLHGKSNPSMHPCFDGKQQYLSDWTGVSDILL